MLTSTDFYKKYGHPDEKKNLVMWDVPANLEIGLIPKKIYCNKDLVEPLSKAFYNLIDTGHVQELLTWDGCYNFRPIRGYEKKYEALMKAKNLDAAIKLLSVHSWGCAVDINSFSNGLNQTVEQIKAKGLVPLSDGFLQCFRDAGFDCGGDWAKRPDRMHFQLSSI